MAMMVFFLLWTVACWLALASWLLAALCTKLPATLPGATGVRRTLRGMALVLYVPGLLYSAVLTWVVLTHQAEHERWTDTLPTVLLLQSPGLLPLLACTFLFWRFWRRRHAGHQSAPHLSAH